MKYVEIDDDGSGVANVRYDNQLIHGTDLRNHEFLFALKSQELQDLQNGMTCVTDLTERVDPEEVNKIARFKKLLEDLLVSRTAVDERIKVLSS